MVKLSKSPKTFEHITSENKEYFHYLDEAKSTGETLRAPSGSTGRLYEPPISTIPQFNEAASALWDNLREALAESKLFR